MVKAAFSILIGDSLLLPGLVYGLRGCLKCHHGKGPNFFLLSVFGAQFFLSAGIERLEVIPFGENVAF